MMHQPQRRPALDAVLAFTGHARFIRALALCIVGTAFLSHTLTHTIGTAGLSAIMAALLLLSGLSLVDRRGSLQWRGVLPISLLVFLGWSALSIFWSSYQWATLGSLIAQLAIAALGIYVALVRDTIQILRTFGDVLRALLAASLALEIFSGLLIDSPIRFLGIAGNLDALGPLQGLFGSRNQLGLVALLALVTFGTELLTTSVTRARGIGSLVLAGVAIIFSQSPVSVAVLIALGFASLALLGLRRMRPELRRAWQFGFGAAGLVAIGLGYLFRGRILTLLDATNEFDYRVRLWRATGELMQSHPIEGWGWIGEWRADLIPFFAIDSGGGRAHFSALNAFIDVWFQLGAVGLLSLMVLTVLALGRSWILASTQRSRVYVWLALMLVTLLSTSLAESSLLIDFGWLTLVICAVKAAENLSWRHGLPD